MPVIKLSKVTIPPPRPKPTPVSEPLPGAPFPPPPFDGVPTDALPGAGDPVAEAPVEAPVDTPVDPRDGQVGEPVGTFAAAARGAAPDGTASIPTELVERLWRAVEIVPGLTLDTALTLALQQFLASIPDDYEREDG